MLLKEIRCIKSRGVTVCTVYYVYVCSVLQSSVVLCKVIIKVQLNKVIVTNVFLSYLLGAVEYPQ